MIVVDYVELASLQRRIRRAHADIGDQLTALARTVDYVRQNWEGASAEGFQRTVAEWQSAVADLRDRLAAIHNMVASAHDNHADAVRAGVRRWGGRSR